MLADEVCRREIEGLVLEAFSDGPDKKVWFECMHQKIPQSIESWTKKGNTSAVIYFLDACKTIQLDGQFKIQSYDRSGYQIDVLDHISNQSKLISFDACERSPFFIENTRLLLKSLLRTNDSIGLLMIGSKIRSTNLKVANVALECLKEHIEDMTDEFEERKNGDKKKEQREAIISIIVTYRDDIKVGNREYYNDMIQKVMTCSENELDMYERIVDDWIDS